jgi:hypothetical protein
VDPRPAKLQRRTTSPSRTTESCACCSSDPARKASSLIWMSRRRWTCATGLQPLRQELDHGAAMARPTLAQTTSHALSSTRRPRLRRRRSHPTYHAGWPPQRHGWNCRAQSIAEPATQMVLNSVTWDTESSPSTASPRPRSVPTTDDYMERTKGTTIWKSTLTTLTSHGSRIATSRSA